MSWEQTTMDETTKAMLDAEPESTPDDHNGIEIRVVHQGHNATIIASRQAEGEWLAGWGFSGQFSHSDRMSALYDRPTFKTANEALCAGLADVLPRIAARVEM